LTIRAEGEAANAGVPIRRIQRGEQVIAVQCAARFLIAIGDRLECKSAGDMIKASTGQSASGASIAFLACAASDRSTRQIRSGLAQEESAMARGRGRDRRRVPKPPRDDLAERAEGAGDDDDFSVHDCLTRQQKRSAHYRQRIHLQWARLFTGDYVFNVRW